MRVQGNRECAVRECVFQVGRVEKSVGLMRRERPRGRAADRRVRGRSIRRIGIERVSQAYRSVVYGERCWCSRFGRVLVVHLLSKAKETIHHYRFDSRLLPRRPQPRLRVFGNVAVQLSPPDRHSRAYFPHPRGNGSSAADARPIRLLG